MRDIASILTPNVAMFQCHYGAIMTELYHVISHGGSSVSMPLWCNYDSLILEMIGIDSLGIMEQIEGVFDGFSRRGVVIEFCGEVDDWIERGGLG